MSKILSLDLGSSSCRLLLTEKSITNFEILFYAEKTYAEPVRDTFNEENRIIVTNQLIFFLLSFSIQFIIESNKIKQIFSLLY